MSKQNDCEDNILKLIFQGVAWANLADNAASGPLTSLYVSLHTADPGEAGSQSTNECDYTGYARVAVSRSSSDWSVSSGTASNVNNVTFGECTAGSNTASHFGIGSTLSGAGVLYYSGALTASLAISSGITPYFAATDIDVGED